MFVIRSENRCFQLRGVGPPLMMWTKSAFSALSQLGSSAWLLLFLSVLFSFAPHYAHVRKHRFSTLLPMASRTLGDLMIATLGRAGLPRISWKFGPTYPDVSLPNLGSSFWPNLGFIKTTHEDLLEDILVPVVH
uniref:Secreted protein n=1 Tax=Steinernema glaseri TaxID=37863 RepID=A0A1I7YAF8_9BILA